ncbi:YraN family protein [Pseudooceanicola sp.]|uniref:YraN family protein n=1 Tax=Pseudooceanicola sp. TaxID=1914328 RepID=UPI00261EB2B4|nr:YraN family protein [Pseudooceanicola sp.]MDF1856124.1 YraN family protein [Pseudooceanicola sp.]
MRHWQQGFWPEGPAQAQPVVPSQRQHRGRAAHLAGAAAEDRVVTDYLRRGYHLAARRWRGQGGEIDIILRGNGQVVFVEVKQGPDFDSAAARLQPRQIARICGAAEEFVSGEPAGALTDIRFDLALVDRIGAIQILENALAG